MIYNKNWAFITGCALTVFGWGGAASLAIAQESEQMEDQVIEEVIVTGSRIKRIGLVSTSPIISLDAEELALQQEPEVERILRDLPITIPADGQNVNNGTNGVATTDLRGLGHERNLVLFNGRRMTPANFQGIVDISTIPVALIERIDIITGGASAVYGSDAIAGAVNFIPYRDFEGADVRLTKSRTDKKDGDVDSVSVTLGSGLSDGKGNVAFNLTWADRSPVLLGSRALGQVGIDAETGGGLEEFRRGGEAPLPNVTGCTGPSVVATNAAGSTTAIPTRVAIVGGGNVGQFLNDRTIYTGPDSTGDPTTNGGGCSRFNFNPFNYYQTPQERYSAFFTGNFEFDDRLKVYSTFQYSNITVKQQIAPSGTFGAAFNVPLANPFLSDQARDTIIEVANRVVMEDAGKPVDDRRLTAGGEGSNWNDVNNNGVVDQADYLKMQLRRRTLELGNRLETFDSDYYSIVLGVTGDLAAEWEYDIAFQYGESNRTTVRSGYTHRTNVQNALDATSKTACNGGDPACVPLDLFGGFGTITAPMGRYLQATALQQQKYEQSIVNVVLNGPVGFFQLPTAQSPLALSVGYERREEFSALTPDECLRLAPDSCQGGAGGNLLPITGEIDVSEFFMEGYLPLIEGATLAHSLALEFGYRSSDYNTIGNVDTWKIGVNWQPVEALLVRAMVQKATRAPNIEELFSPIVTGLDNATNDPCSVANAGNISDELRQRCLDTGVRSGQIGVVQDIVSKQINVIQGSDPDALPDAENADTLTLGAVWSLDPTDNVDIRLSLDYYDIDITNVIGEVSAQEILDGCYVRGDEQSCSRIMRVNGDFTSSASGILLYTRNLEYRRVEGIELGFNVGLDLGRAGDLQFSGILNKYLTNESKSLTTTPVIDCNGFYGTTCDPVSALRWTMRTTWNWQDLTLSMNWRHIDGMDVEKNEADNVFSEFRSIDNYDYLDVSASYRLFNDTMIVRIGIDNVLDKDPPLTGDGIGDTSSNSGNTFPSNYDTVGAVYTLGFNLRF